MSENVKVINTSANPVPVTPSSVINQPEGTLNVEVINTSANPVYVQLVYPPLALDGTPSTATQTANTTQTISITTTGTTDIIFIAAVIQSTGHQINSITATGLTFSRVQQQTVNSPSYDLWQATTATPQTATSASVVIDTAAENWAMIAFAFSGIRNLNYPIDDSAFGLTTGTGGTPSFTGLTTTNSTDGIIGLVAINVTSTTETAGAGFTFGTDVKVSTTNYLAFEYQFVTALQNNIAVPWGTAVGATNKWVAAGVSIVH